MSPEGPKLPLKKPEEVLKLTFGLFIVIIIVSIALIVGLPIKSIEQSTYGVKVNNWTGEVSADLLNPGFNVSTDLFPFISTVYEYTSVRHIENIKGQETNTRDGQRINVDVRIEWKLIANQLHPTSKTPYATQLYLEYKKPLDEIKTTRWEPAFKAAINNAFAQVHSNESYSSGKPKAAELIKSELRKVLADDGVVISRVDVVDVILPPAIQSLVEGKVRSEQDKLKAAVELEKLRIDEEKKVVRAEKTAEAEIAQAEGEATAKKLRSEAEAYANTVVSKSLTPALLQLELAKMEVEKAKVINPTVHTMIMPSNANIIPFNFEHLLGGISDKAKK